MSLMAWVARRSVALAPLVLVVSLADIGPARAAAGGPAGSAGTDTALPATDSAVTVTARPCTYQTDGCGFQNLKITVNQTRNLLNQAISVTWTGGTPATKVQTNV